VIQSFVIDLTNLLEPFCDPNFYESLTRDAAEFGFTVEPVNDPSREIDIHTPRFLVQAPRF